MQYNLSVVQLCPDEHKLIAEAVAEEKGYGPNNLSVRLIKESDGSTWWGCHAYWGNSDVFEAQMQVPEETPQMVKDALASVISSAKENVDGYLHWIETLQMNGMRVADNGEA